MSLRAATAPTPTLGASATRTAFAAWVALTLGAGVGCSSSGESAPSAEHPTVSIPYVSPDPSDASVGEDGPDSTATAASSQGSPLCNASHFAGPCFPDDPATAKSCGLALDGGPTVLACHVTVMPADPAASMAATTVEPTCSLPGPGGEGAACAQPGDCAAGKECVGTGTCRHYCCAGDMACEADEFCDTQPLVQTPDRKVPVCLPIHACGLLDDADAGTCPSTETCAVVRTENGATGCLPVGNARAGESCETDYCARGLTCLGTWNEYRCYALCHTAAPVECSSGQACKGSFQLFPDPAFGVCM